MDLRVAGRESQLIRSSSPIAGVPADRARYFHNDVHQRHAPTTEWGGSGLIACAEIPSRVTVIEQALMSAGAQLEVAPPADRRVLQRIHSTGYLDFLLHYDYGPFNSPFLPVPRTEGVSFFTALEEQLGLKLEPTREVMDVLVIDSVERPPPD